MPSRHTDFIMSGGPLSRRRRSDGMDGDLTQKAHDRSQAGRGELLEALMRTVIMGRRPTPAEAELFFDIARRLLAVVSPEVRQVFSQEVAAMYGTPVDVLLTLAHDAGEIAGPVLRSDNALQESHLVELSGSLPLGHLSDLAARRRLSVPVTDVLARRGGRAGAARTGEQRYQQAVEHHGGAHGGSGRSGRRSLPLPWRCATICRRRRRSAWCRRWPPCCADGWCGRRPRPSLVSTSSTRRARRRGSPRWANWCARCRAAG